MDKIKIALVGYGSMGKEIEKMLDKNEFVVTDIFDEYNLLYEEKNYDFDVAIDFTTPTSVIKNVEILSKLKKNIVIGTTGWYEKIDYVRELAEKNNICIIWGSNFSVGMMIYFKAVELLSKLANINEEYDIFAHEFHHKLKKDSPSGTAVSIGNIILENVARKSELQIDTSHNQIEPDKLHFTSTRGGYIPGTHTVYLDSFADTVEITHRARSRAGFASGAIKAAKLCKNYKGLHQFSDLMLDLWSKI